VRGIRMPRARWRGLEAESRSTLTGPRRGKPWKQTRGILGATAPVLDPTAGRRQHQGHRMPTGQSSERGSSTIKASHRWYLATAIMIGLLLRAGWNLIVQVRPVSDYLWYFERATWLAAGSGYITGDGLPTAYFPVGYPAFLAVLFVVFGHSLMVVKAANIVLSTATIWVVARLSERMLVTGESRRYRIVEVAAFLFALFPSQVLYTALVSDSVLFQFLLCTGTLALLTARTGWRRLAAGGAIFGLATLTRPYAIVVPGVLMACQRRRGGFGVRVRRLILVYVAVVMVLIPWMLRNARSLGGLVPVSTNGGVNLLIGSGPGATGAFTETPLAPMKEAALSEYDADRLAWRLGAEAILRNPLRFIGLAPRKIVHLFADDAQALRWNLKGMRARTSPARYSSLELTGMGIVQFYYSLIVLGSLTFVALAIRSGLLRRDVSALGLWIMAAFTCTSIGFFGDPRFHFSLTPFMCFYAACFWESVRHRPWVAWPRGS